MKSIVTEKEGSIREIDIVIDAEQFESYWSKAAKKVQEMVEMDGFRKGHVPEDVIVKKYGDMIILEEMANMAIKEFYLAAIKEHLLVPVSEPSVTIKKLAKGNPFEVTISVAILPEVKLPDYRKLAKEETITESTEPTDEEVTGVLQELQKGKQDKGDSQQDHAEHDHHGHDHDHDHSDPNHVHVDGDEHSHAKEFKAEETAPLPPIDDAFAQSFGDSFKTLVDLKKKVKENMTLEKKQKLTEKRRQAIMERLIKEVSVDVPEVMVRDEMERMLSQMKQDVTRFGGTWEEYLVYAKKSEEELKDSWKEIATKRIVGQIILAKIAEKEKLVATQEEVEVALVRFLAEAKDSNEPRAKEYLYQVLSNEKVFVMLEKEMV